MPHFDMKYYLPWVMGCNAIVSDNGSHCEPTEGSSACELLIASVNERKKRRKDGKEGEREGEGRER